MSQKHAFKKKKKKNYILLICKQPCLTYNIKCIISDTRVCDQHRCDLERTLFEQMILVVKGSAAAI